MIAETRYNTILEILRRQKTATVQQLSEVLNISESTIRRDLTTLAEQGKLNKVHGGATLIEQQFYSHEQDMITKEGLYAPEKERIGICAASLISAGDFVYIDAGSTTLQLVNHIEGEALQATYVTNGLAHTRVLARKGCTVYVPAGRIKSSTEAIVGAAVLNSLHHYNFTKAFMGANGISLERGFTTPGIEEAELKAAAMQSAYESWVLADESKFNKVYSAGFCDLVQAAIITNRLPDPKYYEHTLIKETDRL